MQFAEEEISRQEAYRRRHWSEWTDGADSTLPGHLPPCRLPPGYEPMAFFPPAADDILAYCRERRLPIRNEARNLKSTLVACLNVLFPLRGRPELACLALACALPGLVRVNRLEFLFPDDRTLVMQLGGTGHKECRCDAAIWWADRSGLERLSLCNWSYIETGYGTCGGFRSRHNDAQSSCLHFPPNDTERSGACYLSRRKGTWLRWEQLAETGIGLDRAATVAGCPFRGPFYQILRYFVLAASLRGRVDVDQVDVVFVSFRGNCRLNRAPRHLARLDEDIIRAWNGLLDGVPALRSIHVEEIVAGLGRDRSGATGPLLRYLEERYGLSGADRRAGLPGL